MVLCAFEIYDKYLRVETGTTVAACSCLPGCVCSVQLYTSVESMDEATTAVDEPTTAVPAGESITKPIWSNELAQDNL